MGYEILPILNYTLDGEELHVFKRLELESHERFEFVAVLFAAVCKAIVNRVAETLEIVVKMIVQTFLLQKFPITFNQIQIRRIARKENQFDSQQQRIRPDPTTTLIRSVIQNHLDHATRMEQRQFAKQLNHARRIDVRRIRYGDHRSTNRMIRTKNIVTLATT